MIIPVVMTIYEDRSFSFILKTPPASNLIMKAIGLAKRICQSFNHKSRQNHRQTNAGKSRKRKCTDLNANDLAAAERIIRGTAGSMGVEVID